MKQIELPRFLPVFVGNKNKVMAPAVRFPIESQRQPVCAFGLKLVESEPVVRVDQVRNARGARSESPHNSCLSPVGVDNVRLQLSQHGAETVKCIEICKRPHLTAQFSAILNGQTGAFCRLFIQRASRAGDQVCFKKGAVEIRDGVQRAPLGGSRLQPVDDVNYPQT